MLSRKRTFQNVDLGFINLSRQARRCPPTVAAEGDTLETIGRYCETSIKFPWTWGGFCLRASNRLCLLVAPFCLVCLLLVWFCSVCCRLEWQTISKAVTSSWCCEDLASGVLVDASSLRCPSPLVHYSRAAGAYPSTRVLTQAA